MTLDLATLVDGAGRYVAMAMLFKHSLETWVVFSSTLYRIDFDKELSGTSL